MAQLLEILFYLIVEVIHSQRKKSWNKTKQREINKNRHLETTTVHGLGLSFIQQILSNDHVVDTGLVAQKTQMSKTQSLTSRIS